MVSPPEGKEGSETVPTVTPTLEPAAFATVPAKPAEPNHDFGRTFAPLLLPVIVVGYHLAITVLKLTASRRS